VNVVDAYLHTAGQAVAMLRTPEVAAAWAKPSALAEMSVAALAGHVAYQVFSVEPALESPSPASPAIPLVEHYARAAWVGAAVDSEVSTGIREKGAGIASEGPSGLADRAAAALESQRPALGVVGAGHAVFMPQTGWALSLDDFLTTRLLELTVHQDDLAVSVGIETPAFADAAFDPVLVLLTRLAARRHGQVALLRALTRAERAPAAINAL
jgi:hypothetical protein